jgi:uncharacterized RDD family membrane protein YckC
VDGVGDRRPRRHAGDPDTRTSEDEETGGPILLAFLTVWFNYLVCSESRWGRTFGKLVLDLRVVGEHGRKVSWNRSLVRNLLRLPTCCSHS